MLPANSSNFTRRLTGRFPSKLNPYIIWLITAKDDIPQSRGSSIWEIVDIRGISEKFYNILSWILKILTAFVEMQSELFIESIVRKL
jgi:hypothetical protein